MNTEKFDISRFKNYPDFVSEEEKKNLPSRKDSLDDGTVIEYSWEGNKANRTRYTKTITPPPPVMFQTVKDYYPSGGIERESKVFVGKLMIEPFFNNIITKDYDKQGMILKVTDNSSFDSNVKIKLNKLLEILQMMPIITEVPPSQIENINLGIFNNTISNKDVTATKIINQLQSKDLNGKILNPFSDVDRRNITISLEGRHWLVTKDMYPIGYWDYKIDSDTGEIVEVIYRIDQRP